jgi:hypothetical protein
MAAKMAQKEAAGYDQGVAQPDARQGATHSRAGTPRTLGDRLPPWPEHRYSAVCRDAGQTGGLRSGGPGTRGDDPGEPPAFRHGLPACRGHPRRQPFEL